MLMSEQRTKIIMMTLRNDIESLKSFQYNQNSW